MKPLRGVKVRLYLIVLGELNMQAYANHVHIYESHCSRVHRISILYITITLGYCRQPEVLHIKIHITHCRKNLFSQVAWA
jgi:hypothetical protein